MLLPTLATKERVLRDVATKVAPHCGAGPLLPTP
jgi:hypothetical protein